MAYENRNAYGEILAKLAKENEDIVVLDADLSGSTKTAMVKKETPERHFNAGIAECNMMGMAAGIAASGKTVFASSFAMFAAGRAYEIIRNSICYPNLNVKVCATHAGLAVGEDGASHQCIEDIALMRVIPNMKVFVPADQYETRALIRYIAKLDGPCYVRMGRGKVEDVFNEETIFDFSKVRTIKEGEKVLIIATGVMVQEALLAAESLIEKGVNATVINVCSIKPIDKVGILEALSKHQHIFVAEEHNIYGGLYGAISEVVINSDNPKKIVPICVEDTFGESGKSADVLKKYGMSAENIEKIVLTEINK